MSSTSWGPVISAVGWYVGPFSSLYCMSSTSCGLAINALGAVGMWGLFLPSNVGNACPVHPGVQPSVLLEPLVCGVFFFLLM